MKPGSGAASGTGHGFCVVSAVRWIGVLPFAFLAHRKLGHGGHRSVVGELIRDGVSGAAMSAVGERIPVPSIF